MKSKYMSNQLDGKEIPICNTVKGLCNSLDNYISENISECREKTLALTRLEECAMWATKAVAMNGTKQ